MSLFGFGEQSGFFGDARAMTADEIKNWEIQNISGMAQAVWPNDQRLANYQPYPDRPLDERFADFKLQLAAAIARRAA